MRRQTGKLPEDSNPGRVAPQPWPVERTERMCAGIRMPGPPAHLLRRPRDACGGGGFEQRDGRTLQLRKEKGSAQGAG